MEFIKVSWEKLYKDCLILSQYAKTAQASEIVAISRGGIVIGRLLSDFLSLPMSHISMHSYVGTMKTKEPEIGQGLTKDVSGKTILLVDDVADTGITFLKAVPYLEKRGASKVFSVSPYMKFHSQYTPQFCVERTDNWLVFPYEIHETQKTLERELGSKELAKKKLLEIGIAEWELKNDTDK